jgi:excisionase family DNA binding protein
MTTFLTTQDVQELLHVDKSTVYRMAEDGRLPGVKVGRQWRFPADRIAEQLGVPDTPAPLPQHAGQSAPHLTDLLDAETVRTVAELLAELYGLMAVVTDMDGDPLTPVVNPCGFYTAIAEQPAAAELCVTEWRAFARQPLMSPRFTPSHLGFHCARTFAWAGTQPVGMLLIGGVTPPDWPPPADFVARIAAAIAVPPADLEAVVDQTFDVPIDRQRWMLRTLPQVGDLVTQLLTAQRRVVSKLDAIADLARPSPTRPSPTRPPQTRPPQNGIAS